MGICIVQSSAWWGFASYRETDVKAMERRPPPAPARACATLSLCCSAVVVTWTASFNSYIDIRFSRRHVL